MHAAEKLPKGCLGPGGHPSPIKAAERGKPFQTCLACIGAQIMAFTEKWSKGASWAPVCLQAPVIGSIMFGVTRFGGFQEWVGGWVGLDSWTLPPPGGPLCSNNGKAHPINLQTSTQMHLSASPRPRTGGAPSFGAHLARLCFRTLLSDNGGVCPGCPPTPPAG